MSEWPVGFPPPFHIQDVLPRSADGSQGPPPMQDDDKPPRTDGKRDSQPTPKGPKAAGPGSLHGASPNDSGLDLEPCHSDEGRPALDPKAMAQRVLEAVNPGPKAAGDAGLLVVAAREDDHGPA